MGCWCRSGVVCWVVGFGVSWFWVDFFGVLGDEFCGYDDVLWWLGVVVEVVEGELGCFCFEGEGVVVDYGCWYCE